MDWHARLPLGAKALLLCGATLVASACWLFQLAGAQCFVAFRITDDIDLPLGPPVGPGRHDSAARGLFVD